MQSPLSSVRAANDRLSPNDNCDPLGADAQSVRSILDIASLDNHPVGGLERRANLKMRVVRLRAGASIGGGRHQCEVRVRGCFWHLNRNRLPRGIITAILAELLDTTIRNAQQIEVYQKPIIALLPDGERFR